MSIGARLTSTASLQWPKDPQLPVELFELITSHLPRSTVQNMRVVSKEFESKVSGYLFKVVVVPFRPEIYGIAPEPTLAGMADLQRRALEGLEDAVMLQDKGMRVFQGFGSHIKKFAMSFEYDEKKLASPPTKSDQEAITSFWGIYRWPFKKYNRYTALEGLEQTADETRTMAKALRYIYKASELGLSMDGGLGWLAGPDTNQKVLERGAKLSVFGESKFVPEEKPTNTKGTRIGPNNTPAGFFKGQHATFQRMLQERGLNGESLEAGVQMMIEAEDTGGGNFGTWQDDSFFGSHSAASSFNSTANFPSFTNQRPNLASLSFAIQTNNTSVPQIREADAYDDDDDDDDEEEEEEEEETRNVNPAVALLKAKTEGHALKPNELTNAQREMLLEIEWAQRAFMQSYTIAIIDNPDTFQNVETLTIARIPNRHLPILRREDFWDSLPQLKKLSLAVIPDWRDVVKLPTSWVQDLKVPPSLSIPGVFRLLQDQISRRKSIKTLHFEWLCGGEEAPGLFARNHYILAAPLVNKAMDMVNRVTFPPLLTLPHIEHLSLKNCWITPHVLVRLGLTMKKQALQTLTLESVSLTAALPLSANPSPVAGHNLNQAAQNAVLHFQAQQNAHAAGNAVPAAPALAPSTHHDAVPDWLEPPRIGSWASVIDTLTPGNTIADVRYARAHDLYGPEPRDTGTITKLDFRSCGYLRLPLDFDQSALDPAAGVTAQTVAISKRISDLDSMMMKPGEYALGTIINHICRTEIATLENVYNMTRGWGADRQVLALEAATDGVVNPGQGRFSGVIWEAPQSASS